MALRTLDDLGPLSGKVVLVRCDLNVPLKDGVITDDGRVQASVPTIRAILDAGGTVVAMSHLGRPDGAPDPQYSLAPVATRLSELLGEDVAFGEPGDSRVTLLENLRFDPRETSKDAGSARRSPTNSRHSAMSWCRTASEPCIASMRACTSCRRRCPAQQGC